MDMGIGPLAAMWVCPYCGRAVKQMGHYQTGVPNTTCGPHYDASGQEFMVAMTKVYPVARPINEAR